MRWLFLTLALLLVLPFSGDASRRRLLMSKGAPTGAGGGGSDPDLLWWKCNDGSGTTITANVGPNGTTDVDWASTGETQNGAGSALKYNGSSDESFTSTTLNFGTSIATLTFWIYVTDWTSGSENVFAETGDNYGSGPARFNIGYSASSISCNLYHGGGGRIESIDITSKLLNNTWYLIGAVWDNSTVSGDIKLYTNGVLATTTLVSDAKVSSGNLATETVNFGARDASGTPSARFTGRQDDIRIYSGEKDSTFMANLFSGNAQ